MFAVQIEAVYSNCRHVAGDQPNHRTKIKFQGTKNLVRKNSNTN